MTENKELVEGQIYRWSWADPKRHEDGLRSWGTYHCKSQIAIVKNGHLIDTYWFGASSENAVRLEDVEIKLLCDISWPTIQSYQTPLYEPSDYVDTRHPNNSSGPIYLKPGASKSPTRMLQEIEYREEKASGEIRTAQWHLERLAKDRENIAAGKLDEVMF